MFSIVNCDKETNGITHDVVKCAIKLSNNNIPVLKGIIETGSGGQPRLWEAGWNEKRFYIVKFVYSWNLSDDDFVNVDLVV